MAIGPTKNFGKDLVELLLKKNMLLKLRIEVPQTSVEFRIENSNGRVYISTYITRKEWDAINMHPQTHSHYLPIIAEELQLL